MWSAPYEQSRSAARADALFASALQRSDEPSAAQVEQAIAAATHAFGDLGCAARVAQEYGEHPETAAGRMRWARTAVAGVFGDPPSDPRGTRPGTACPPGYARPRAPRATWPGGRRPAPCCRPADARPAVVGFRAS